MIKLLNKKRFILISNNKLNYDFNLLNIYNIY